MKKRIGTWLLERFGRVESNTDSKGTVARFLQYEIREGREAGEAVVRNSRGVANCNKSFLLHGVN